ncbi:MAG: D-glycero-beta-D-manno-heptose-7-phosphate kinase [Candidatus Omnitrophica bacterium]|nr:D-glycero-beta-D-manno-heptose-7-phosphate kinase [Candidatus Omnitrophota bacterium]
MKNKLNIERFKKIILEFSGTKILVIGDLMLDEFIWGDVERISPEAPVPVVWAKKRTYAPGGASNVASNISSLGAQVTLVGVIGSDLNGKTLKSEFKRRRIDTSGIFVQSDRHTTLKTRIISGHQQVVRLDWEDRHPIKKEIELRIAGFISKNIKEYDAIIIEDYGKGVITAGLLTEIRSMIGKYGIIVAVDPKEEHFDYYDNFTVITPNRKETENAIRYLKIKGKRNLNINDDNLASDRQIDLAGEELRRCLNLEALLITLGEHGMRLFEKGKVPHHIPTVAQEVFDVAGAGDTVISVFTLALSQGASMIEAAYLSNFAAGIVVGKSGVAVTDQRELISCLNKAVYAPKKLK